ncbi:hypothetical protein J2X68_000551 [Streptomyces sp. 3330]|uniref:hypothetical protein n=1 Tax=Streptomyces sp. 3330 TaxID=2817755 RepID=UPI0028603858|nr:hypothetical protein [Streptomyces sp. 3330]MDR6973882.1 hypothetical protein [Streptomyces sp. 3330]
MRNLYSLVVAASVASLAIPVAATPAAAATYENSCFSANVAIAGASGGGRWNYASRTKLDPMTLFVTDRKSDGHSVGVRLVTRRSDGSNAYWAWHRLSAGAGNSQSWGTNLTDSAGVRQAWTQVAVFEGDAVLQLCVTPVGTNQHW